MTDRCPDCGRDPELGYCTCPDPDPEPVVEGDAVKAIIAEARATIARAQHPKKPTPLRIVE